MSGTNPNGGRERIYPKLPGSPVRTDWRPEEFTQAIRDHGVNLWWEKASRCVCLNSEQSQQAKVDCPVCYGVGWEYWGGQQVRGIVGALDLNPQSQVAFGQWSAGMAQITIESAHRPNYRDRYVSMSTVLPYSELRYRRTVPGSGVLERLRYLIATRTDLTLWPDSPKPLPVNAFPGSYVDSADQPVTTYVEEVEAQQMAQVVAEAGPAEKGAPIAVTRIRVINPATRNPMPDVLVEGQDFAVVEGRIDWSLGDQRGTAPAPDQRYSVTYNYNPRYIVTGFNHAARDQYLPGNECAGGNSGGPQRIVRFPVEVLAKLETLMEEVPGD